MFKSPSSGKLRGCLARSYVVFLRRAQRACLGAQGWALRGAQKQLEFGDLLHLCLAGDMLALNTHVRLLPSVGKGGAYRSTGASESLLGTEVKETFLRHAAIT